MELASTWADRQIGMLASEMRAHRKMVSSSENASGSSSVRIQECLEKTPKKTGGDVTVAVAKDAELHAAMGGVRQVARARAS